MATRLAQYIIIGSNVFASIAGSGAAFDTLADAEKGAEELVLQGGGPRIVLCAFCEVKSVSVVSELFDPPSDYVKFAATPNDTAPSIPALPDIMPTAAQLDAAHADLQSKIDTVSHPQADGAGPFDVVASRIPHSPGV